jgi:hypothetical protein
VPIARGETAKSAEEREGAGVSIMSRLAWLLPAAVVGVAIVMRTRSLENADVSWLLTLAERLVDGHRDFIEVNPPGAIFAYMPAVWMARLLHIPVEAVCDALVFLLAELCLTLAAAILGRRFAERHDMPLLAAASAAVLLILPAHAFGQREHLCVLLILPWTAALAARLDDRMPAKGLLVAAGLACGLSIMIKPHFLLDIVPLTGVLAWRRGSFFMVFTMENGVAALLVALYGIAVWAVFPDFVTEIAPRVAAVYVPDRLELATLVRAPASILWAVIIAFSVATGALARSRPLCIVLVAMSVIGYLVFLLQGKGWAYHSYPAFAFALLALAVRLAAVDAPARSIALRLASAVLALILFDLGIAWFDTDSSRDTRAIARAMESIAAHPTVAMIGGDISVGFPATRLAEGHWAQRSASLWMAAGARRQRSRLQVDEPMAAVLANYEALDRAMLRDDIAANWPDVILVHDEPFDWLGWARRDPQFAAVLDDYEFARQIDDVEIWRRK